MGGLPSGREETQEKAAASPELIEPVAISPVCLSVARSYIEKSKPSQKTKTIRMARTNETTTTASGVSSIDSSGLAMAGRRGEKIDLAGGGRRKGHEPADGTGPPVVWARDGKSGASNGS